MTLKWDLPRSDILRLRTDILICLFLCLITIALYFQVLNHKFVWDDEVYITRNPQVQRGLTPETIVWALTAEVAANWHPMTLLSHMLDCQLYGLNSGMHHVTNLIFHIINTLLLFIVLKKMTGALWQSAFVAALFAIHPFHVESVAWVSGRKDVLSTFFWLLTMWSYARYVRCPVIKRYVPVLLFLALGLLSKPMVVTLPFVLLLMDYWPLNRFQTGRPRIAFRLVLEKIPLLILVAISCFMTFHFQKMAGAVSPLDNHPLLIRLMNVLLSYTNYILKMFWPLKLCAYYPYPKVIQMWQVAGSGIFLFFMTLFVLKITKRYAYIAVGWFWYLGTLVPVIGLVQVGSQAMADRYTYIPLIGLFIIIAWGIPDLLKHWQYKKYFLTAVSLATILVLSPLTWSQVGYWNNYLSLFGHAMEVTHNNAIAHHYVSVGLARQGRTQEAMDHYSDYLQKFPAKDYVHFNLANLLAREGKASEAINHYYAAIRLNPNNAEAHFLLGNILVGKGRFNRALAHFNQTLRIDKDSARTHTNIGYTLHKQGKKDAAIRHCLEAIRLKPDRSIDAYYNLACIYAVNNETQKSVEWLKKAIDKGFNKWDLMKSDKDLDNIRQTLYFKGLESDLN